MIGLFKYREGRRIKGAYLRRHADNIMSTVLALIYFPRDNPTQVSPYRKIVNYPIWTHILSFRHCLTATVPQQRLHCLWIC